MRKALSIVLAGFFLGGFAAPLPLAAQACQGVAVPTGSRSVWLAFEDGTDKLTVGGRYTGERVYGMATVGRVLSSGRTFQSVDLDGILTITQAFTHFLGGTAGFGLNVMPTGPWSVCLGAGGFYGASNSLDVQTYTYFFNQLVDVQPRTTVKANSSAWNSGLEASVGFVFGEAPVWAPRAGISFEYGGTTFDDEAQIFAGGSNTHTGFVMDIGTGVRYGRVLGLITYFRVLTREFKDLDAPPGTDCDCPDGLRVGLGVFF